MNSNKPALVTPTTIGKGVGILAAHEIGNTRTLQELRTLVREIQQLVASEEGLPKLVTLKGKSYYVCDSDGQWYYLNHGHTWQTCPPLTKRETKGCTESF